MIDDLKLEDLEIIKNNKKDPVYNLLVKNNIITLKQLFEMDDLGLINLGKKNYIVDRIRYYQTQGVIKLLRTKYLMEELPFKDTLNSHISFGKLIKDGIILDNKYFVNEFLKLGLTFDFIIFLKQSISNIENIKVIDLIEQVYKKEINILSDRDYEKNKERLKIIIDGYKKNNKLLIKKTNVL